MHEAIGLATHIRDGDDGKNDLDRSEPDRRCCYRPESRCLENFYGKVENVGLPRQLLKGRQSSGDEKG